MDNLKDILLSFKSVNLDEINSIKNSVKLLNRHDTKFVFASDKLKDLLMTIVKSYKILEIDAKRIFSYENLYYDTPENLFYNQHHNNKLNRHKFRFRKYVDSETYYWEIKFKSNKQRTMKNRFKRKSIGTALDKRTIEETQDKINKRFGIDVNSIGPKIWTSFSRITLANKKLKERITLDFGITYKDTKNRKKTLKDICVAELKQENFSLRSPFVIAAKELKIYPKPFSKYCTGVAMLDEVVKTNRFKKRILYLEKLSGGKSKCL